MMTRTLLIVNAKSGSAAAVPCEDFVPALRKAGLPVEHLLKLPDDRLPERAWLEQTSCRAIVIVSGDGTVAGLCEKLGDWPGSILVLPGGTMNLLSRRLHGEVTLPEMLDRLEVAPLASIRIPVICFGEREILTGLTVGPSTRWGDVREGIRRGDVGALAQAVPEAWSDTLADKGVWIEGHPRQAYAGVFVEPDRADALSVIAFRANNIGDMVGHGVAWLRRDFRDGPSDDFGTMREVTVVGDETETGLLIDGEYEDGRLPLTCIAGMSSMRFLTIAR